MSERKLLPRQDRQASILRASATAFARSGFASTSMSEVAEEAGVTRVLLYRHFDSKDALYRAVLDEVLESLDAAWQHFQTAESDTAVMRTHVAAARENPDGYRLLWRHADTEPEFATYAQGVRSGLVAMADERVGDAIKPELRAWAMATLITTIVESVLNWLDNGDAIHDEQFISTSTSGMIMLVDGWSRG